MKKLIILICALILPVTPSVYAMRTKGALFLAHACRRALTPALGTEFDNNIRRLQCDPFTRSEHNHVAGGIASGIATSVIFDLFKKKNTENDLEQEQVPERDPVSIEGLSIWDIPAVLEALAYATEQDKISVAQKISLHIKRYKTPTMIKFLQNSDGRSHRILIQAISKNITSYSTDDIYTILMEDKCDYTQSMLASSVKNNYTYFTTYSVCGLSVYSCKEWRQKFVQMLSGFRFSQQRLLLQQVLEEIEHYDVLHLLSNTDSFHKESILSAFTKSTNIQLSDYGSGRELMRVLEATKTYNQTNLAQLIAQNIDAYNEWHFLGFLKTCNLDAQKIIAQAITENVEKNPRRYELSNILCTVKLFTASQIESISAALNKHITSRSACYCNPKSLSLRCENTQRSKD